MRTRHHLDDTLRTGPHPNGTRPNGTAADPSVAAARPDPAAEHRGRPVPRAWGWPVRGGGRAGHVEAGARYTGTTSQLCGLFPFAISAGATVVGVPVGRHLHTAEPVGLDPAAWLRTGLVSNTGVWVQGQPGIGKSSITKRLLTGLVGYGMAAVIPGDVKGEYTPLIEALGGAVWRIGRGRHALNPLDAGPLQLAQPRRHRQRPAAARRDHPRPPAVPARSPDHHRAPRRDHRHRTPPARRRPRHRRPRHHRRGGSGGAGRAAGHPGRPHRARRRLPRAAGDRRRRRHPRLPALRPGAGQHARVAVRGRDPRAVRPPVHRHRGPGLPRPVAGHLRARRR